MRQALARNPARRQTAVARQVPAPVGGWDTESPQANMPARNAIILDNCIPRSGYVEVRRGYVQQTSGFTSAVQTLVTWAGSDTGDKMFACAANKIYDVTTAGSLGAAAFTASASSYSARWNWINFSNDAGRYALMVNGVNIPTKYDGSNFSTTAITGTSGAITLAPKDLKFVMSHKRRLHFAERARLRVWFLAINAIAGASQLLDLGPIFTKGGIFAGIATWTLDGGAGADDMAVYVTTEGQVAIYQGTDPSDANNWALIGVYNVAKPIGDRCLVQYGADLAVITEDGALLLSVILGTPVEEQKSKALSAKIATAFSDSAISYGSNFGWQPIFYPGRGSLLIVNVPTEEGVDAVQYVRSMQNGAWGRFTGLPAVCWGYANSNIYFGSEDAVYQWDTGASDNGETIVADVKPAFNDFGNRLVEKQFTMVRALYRAPSIIHPALEVLTDYRERVPVAQQTIVQAGDINPNDPNQTRYDWTTATATGYVGAPRMRISILGDGDTDRIAIDSSLDLLLDTTGGDHILTRPNLPLDVPIQLIAFDVMFNAGGQL